MTEKGFIYLRAPELTDLETIQAWENDQSLWHLSSTLLPFSRFSIEQYILNEQVDIFSKKQARFMISLRDSNNREKDCVGAVDLFDFDPKNRRAGVGILLDANYRKQGYATKALEQLVDYSFRVLNLHQLYCSIETDNTDSLNLFEKLEFEIIGIQKDWILRNNVWKDVYLLQLVNKKTS